LVRYDRQGESLEPLSIPFVVDPFQFLPGGDRLVLTLYQTLKIVDGEGAVPQTISRRPDNRWFEMIDDVAVASDGSFAVLDNRVVSIYDSGSPVRPHVAAVPRDGVNANLDGGVVVIVERRV